MVEIADLKEFDLDTSELTVWVFKKQTRDGQPVYKGRWVSVAEALAVKLRKAVAASLGRVDETIEYDILAQNHETSFLRIGADETHISLVDAEATNPTDGRKVRSDKDLENTEFYMLKFASDLGSLLAVRKTNATWKTKKSRGFTQVVFSDLQLEIDDRPTFNFDSMFDFFVIGEQIFISDKTKFESVLSYKVAHALAFESLLLQDDFNGIFSDASIIAKFVGTNKIQLRRAVAIREKGHFRDATFMQNLRDECVAMSLRIAFDDNGKIVPTIETCRDIFTALLDFRLYSRLSGHLYNVQSTEPLDDNGP